MFSYEWQTCPIRNLGSKNHNPRLVTSNPRLMTSNPRLVKSNPRLRRQSHPRPKDSFKSGLELEGKSKNG